MAVPGVSENPARASREDVKRRWLQQLGCEEGQGKAAAARGRTARVRARPRPADASRRSEPRSSVKVGLMQGVLVHREDGPSPAPAYLPSLTSGAWPSSVTTCGRGGRRCRSPSASLILQLHHDSTACAGNERRGGQNRLHRARGNDVEPSDGEACRPRPFREIGTASANGEGGASSPPPSLGAEVAAGVSRTSECWP